MTMKALNLGIFVVFQGRLPTFAVLSSFVAEAATLELLLVVPWSTKTWDEYDVLMVFIEPSPSVFMCPQSYIG